MKLDHAINNPDGTGSFGKDSMLIVEEAEKDTNQRSRSMTTRHRSLR
jgi:hypothetical protein